MVVSARHKPAFSKWETVKEAGWVFMFGEQYTVFVNKKLQLQMVQEGNLMMIADPTPVAEIDLDGDLMEEIRNRIYRMRLEGSS